MYAAADAFYRAGGANANRGQHPLALAATQVIARTRQKLAAWLGAPHPDRVVLAPSATIALNQVILGSGLRRDDVAYVTPFEHNSVLRPLEQLRKAVGVRVRELPFDTRTFALDGERAEAMLRAAPPAMVVVAQASNVCGLLLPVEEIARAARGANPDCVVVVDGAQVGGLHSIDLRAGLVDYYVFSGHKALYGPYGVAGFVLAGARRPAPILFGGTGTQSESLAMPEELPTAYEPGSQNAWAAAGLDAALDWLAGQGRATVAGRAEDAAEEIASRLSRLPAVQLCAPRRERRTSILSFTVPGSPPQAVASALGARGIAVRAGLHCAPWAHRWLGTLAGGGTVRVSTSAFTPSAAAELLASALRDCIPA